MTTTKKTLSRAASARFRSWVRMARRDGFAVYGTDDAAARECRRAGLVHKYRDTSHTGRLIGGARGAVYVAFTFEGIALARTIAK